MHVNNSPYDLVTTDERGNELTVRYLRGDQSVQDLLDALASLPQAVARPKIDATFIGEAESAAI